MPDSSFGDFEFERKFFVRELPVVAASDPTPTLIVQAYLFAADGYAVRVRIQGAAPTELTTAPGGSGHAPGGSGHAPDELAHTPGDLIDALGAESIGTVTVKGPAVGGTRYEAERELDAQVAGQIARRADHLVAKIRYAVWLGEDGWVLDRFLGSNAPLVLAEVERGGPVVDLVIPGFCATEVSEDDRFRNEYLAHRPYGGWADGYTQSLDRDGGRFVETLGHNHFEGS